MCHGPVLSFRDWYHCSDGGTDGVYLDLDDKSLSSEMCDFLWFRRTVDSRT